MKLHQLVPCASDDPNVRNESGAFPSCFLSLQRRCKWSLSVHLYSNWAAEQMLEGVCTIFIRKPFTDGFLKDQSIKSSTYLLTLPQLYFWNKSNNPSKEPGNSAGWAPTRPSLDQFGGNTTEHLPQEVFFPKGWIPAVSPQEKLH